DSRETEAISELIRGGALIWLGLPLPLKPRDQLKPSRRSDSRRTVAHPQLGSHAWTASAQPPRNAPMAWSKAPSLSLGKEFREDAIPPADARQGWTRPAGGDRLGFRDEVRPS